jgi:hypothetical protein
MGESFTRNAWSLRPARHDSGGPCIFENERSAAAFDSDLQGRQAWARQFKQEGQTVRNSGLFVLLSIRSLTKFVPERAKAGFIGCSRRGTFIARITALHGVIGTRDASPRMRRRPARSNATRRLYVPRSLLKGSL